MDILFTIFVGFIVFVAYYYLFAEKKVEKTLDQKTTKENVQNVKKEEKLEKPITEKKQTTDQTQDACGRNEGCCKNNESNEGCCKNNSVEEEEEEGCGGDCSCGKFEDTKVESPKTKKIKSTDTIKIVYGTQTGTTKEWANKLSEVAKEHNFKNITVVDMTSYDLDDLNDEAFIVFLVSTYTGGNPPDKCVPFFDWLKDHSLDWRVDKASFNGVKFAVFGVGHSIYGENFNVAAKELDRIMNRLTAQRVLPVALADNGAGVEIEPTFNSWTSKLFKSWDNIINNKPSERVARTSEENDEDDDEVEEGEPLVDLEDLGMMSNPGKTNFRVKKPKVKRPKKKKEMRQEQRASNTNNNSNDVETDEDEPEIDDGEFEEVDETLNDGLDKNEREMLTPSLRKSLTKQGYKLLGSHSGVKMCRWTKAMLRGRGGCYKHTFYGIKSYQCMEMTPNLACANKCVFCWRHHSNPVGTEWKWKMDQPQFLLDEAIKQHVQMIKQMKGVPGVVEERYKEAFTVRHCALSLVGEPIAYPEINKFVDMLHEKEISSFMVTNAQFPQAIEELKPVTQLYISVDAATKESLRAIDRPIFPDFWERFLACMDALAKKGQRTVYRLTLVKDWNMEELKNYAELIKRGKPSFVEVKGVTYCGTSKASTLTMQNVPFHQEVINFAKKLCETAEMKDDYEVAVEHEHSCAVLIPHKKFKVDGVWNTWIDYPKFHQLVKSGKEFDALDYMEPSPDWSLIGSKEKGFDPEEVRFRRNKAYQGAGCT